MNTPPDLEARVAELEGTVAQQHDIIAGILNLLKMMRDLDRNRQAAALDDLLNLYDDDDD
jgi:uncharacterized coiled-coil protein SlyX